MSDIEETGPIDWLVLEFDREKITGELIPPLLDLVDRRLIRILDALVIIKRDKLDFDAFTTSELEANGLAQLGALAGASSGLLTDEDAADVATVLDAGSSALVLVFENLWAVPFAVTARKAGAQVVSTGRIPVQALIAQLDALDA
jgi:uncharacterized membrane protein